MRFSLPSYARQIGLSAQQGSVIGAVFNLGQMLGRPCIGLVSDRFGRINVATIFTVGCGIFCLVFWIPTEVTAHPMVLLVFFSIVGGAAAGTFWTTIAPVGAEVVGLRDLPSALSWTWLIMVPPVTCAEPIALELRRFGVVDFVYINAQVFCALSYMAGGICLWVLRGWKIGEVDETERQRIKREEERSRQAALPSEKMGHESEGYPKEALTREISAASARKQGWKPRDLARRMVRPKIV